MKALSFASLLALGIVGTACSQSSETPEPETTTAAAPVADAGSFNLGLPEDSGTAGQVAADGFNLELPSSEASSTAGFNLGTDLSASEGLAAIPEVNTDFLEDPEVPAEEALDDEPVIRLD